MSEEENIELRPEDGKSESPEENTSESDQQLTTYNLPPTTENMETHAQDLHKAPGHGWKHYFFEFFMLFLAVFCGFLAENLREHYVEEAHAKEYAQGLYKDLQNDTADIRKASWYENKTIEMIDSLVDFISSADYLKKNGQLYYYMRLAGWQYNVDWSKATLNQLLSSGSLRNFSNPKLVTLISEYNTLINVMANGDDIVTAKIRRAAAYRDAIFVPKYQQILSRISMDDIFYGRKYPLIDSIKNAVMPLQDKAADLIPAYTNALLDTKSNRNNAQAKHYPKATKLATGIMDLLKEEYHIE